MYLSLFFIASFFEWATCSHCLHFFGAKSPLHPLPSGFHLHYSAETLLGFWLVIELLNPHFTWLICRVEWPVLCHSFESIPPSFSDAQDLLSPLNFSPDSAYPFFSGVFYCKLFWKINIVWQMNLIFYSLPAPILKLRCHWYTLLYLCMHIQRMLFYVVKFHIFRIMASFVACFYWTLFENYLFWYI